MKHFTQNQEPLGDSFEFKDSVVLLKSKLEYGKTWGVSIKEDYPKFDIQNLKNAERIVYFPGKGLWQITTHMNIASVILLVHSKDCAKQSKTITEYLKLTIKRNTPSYKVANLVGYRMFFYIPSGETNFQLSHIFTSKGDILTKGCFENDMGGTFKEFSTVLKFGSDWRIINKDEEKKDQVEEIFTSASQKEQPFAFTPTSNFSSQPFNFTPSSSASSSSFSFGSTTQTTTPSFGSIFSPTPVFGKQLGFGTTPSTKPNTSFSSPPVISGFKFY